MGPRLKDGWERDGQTNNRVVQQKIDSGSDMKWASKRSQWSKPGDKRNTKQCFSNLICMHIASGYY